MDNMTGCTSTMAKAGKPLQYPPSSSYVDCRNTHQQDQQDTAIRQATFLNPNKKSAMAKLLDPDRRNTSLPHASMHPNHLLHLPLSSAMAPNDVTPLPR